MKKVIPVIIFLAFITWITTIMWREWDWIKQKDQWENERMELRVKAGILERRVEGYDKFIKRLQDESSDLRWELERHRKQLAIIAWDMTLDAASFWSWVPFTMVGASTGMDATLNLSISSYAPNHIGSSSLGKLIEGKAPYPNTFFGPTGAKKF